MLTGILDNRDDLRVAVVVNDVASVNVDGAVIRKELVGVDETEVELLELQNGCVCCGASALELAGNVKDLVQVGADRGKPFDHVVIEMSGVADPRAVQYNLEDGGVTVDRVVTVVDAPAFASSGCPGTVWRTVADDGPPPDPTTASSRRARRPSRPSRTSRRTPRRSAR
ncbi:ATP binding protein [Aureococcus anophagefferens]|nr:ATP binding protein [Aureococcus anophagefferens]